MFLIHIVLDVQILLRRITTNAALVLTKARFAVGLGARKEHRLCLCHILHLAAPGGLLVGGKINYKYFCVRWEDERLGKVNMCAHR